MSTTPEAHFLLRWKGRELGPLTLSAIRDKLNAGEISRMHQIQFKDGWMMLEEFMEKHAGTDPVTRMRVEAERREQQLRRDYETQLEAERARHGAMDVRLSQAENVALPPIHVSHTVPQPAQHQPVGTPPQMGTASSASQVSDFLIPSLRGQTVMLWEIVWLVMAGTLPFIIYLAIQSFELSSNWITWLLEGYFCLLLASFLFKWSGATVPLLKRGFGYFLFTIAIGIPLLLQAQSHWPVVRDIYAGTSKQDLGSGLLGFVLGVGVFEELCKALPLLIFSWGRGGMRTRDTVFLAAMSGLGFAFSEGNVYTQNQAALSVFNVFGGVFQNFQQSQNWNEFFKNMDAVVRFQLFGIVSHFIRLISLPLLHASWAGIVGWFIAKGNEHRSWGFVAWGIGIAAFLHGLYDVIVVGFMGPGLASGILVLLIMIVSISLMVIHLCRTAD
jgi:RsiW-degrading membrane proteinase PrsW (M82 family)